MLSLTSIITFFVIRPDLRGWPSPEGKRQRQIEEGGRETDRQTDRQTHTHTHTHTHTERHTDTQANRQADKQTGRQTDITITLPIRSLIAKAYY